MWILLHIDEDSKLARATLCFAFFAQPNLGDCKSTTTYIAGGLREPAKGTEYEQHGRSEFMDCELGQIGFRGTGMAESPYLHWPHENVTTSQSPTRLDELCEAILTVRQFPNILVINTRFVATSPCGSKGH